MTILILVASSYFATNVDNLLLLVGWMLGGRVSRGRLFAAYAIAAIAVLVVSLTLGLSANVIPIDYVGYLGLVPVILGVKLFAEQLRSRDDAPETATVKTFSVAAVATTLFSNSVDTMLVFAPLLADSSAGIDRVIAAGYLVMAFFWFFAAQFFSQRAARLRPVSTAAQWLTPLIMVAIGLYILDNTITDVVPGN
jgi:cadmium resistance protein CadD (predicted permease)